jgi:hypothetical protein
VAGAAGGIYTDSERDKGELQIVELGRLDFGEKARSSHLEGFSST